MSNFFSWLTANCFEGRPLRDPVYVTFSAGLLLVSCIASLDLDAGSKMQLRKGRNQTQMFVHFTTLMYFLTISVLPPSSCSARGDVWVPHAAAVTCRNFAGMYKLQNLEDRKVMTLPGNLDTPKAKLPLSSEGLDFQASAALARELLKRFIP